MSIDRPVPAGEPLCAFGAAGLARLGELYPNVSGKLRHGLSGHPLLTLDALAEAAERMNPAHVECRASRNRNGEGFDFAPPEEAGIAATMRHIDRAGRWVMLRYAEQLPEYAELVQGVIDEISSVVEPRTGKALRLQAFIFVSSPGTLTPFHFDPEYNILFQISGTKFFAIYPPQAPWLTDEVNERFHLRGENLLAWDPAYRDQGTINRLDPGEALYGPYKSPHWVEVGDEPSISLSVTWCSKASYQQDDAYRLNGWLRERGLAPRAPAGLPAGSPLKATAWRAMRRLGLG